MTLKSSLMSVVLMMVLLLSATMTEAQFTGGFVQVYVPVAGCEGPGPVPPISLVVPDTATPAHWGRSGYPDGSGGYVNVGSIVYTFPSAPTIPPMTTKFYLTGRVGEVVVPSGFTRTRTFRNAFALDDPVLGCEYDWSIEYEIVEMEQTASGGKKRRR